MASILHAAETKPFSVITQEKPVYENSQCFQTGDSTIWEYKGMNSNLQALILKGAASPTCNPQVQAEGLGEERAEGSCGVGAEGPGEGRAGGESREIHVMLHYSSRQDRQIGLQHA